MDEENLESIMKRWSDLCLRQPCSFQDHPFGPDSTVFKVAGKDKSTAKMFALLMVLNDEVVLNLKCEPVLADQQRAEFTQITPGYHMSKKHWNSVRAGLEDQMMSELIEDSYDLVVDGMTKRDKEYIRLQATIAKGSLD